MPDILKKAILKSKRSFNNGKKKGNHQYEDVRKMRFNESQSRLHLIKYMQFSGKY
jgi:hypothetical protein